jgi:hypothetical protein
MTNQNLATIKTTEAAPAGFHFRNAYAATTAAREALDPAELVHLSFDITLAADMVLNAAPRIARMSEDIKKLPVDQELVAQLTTYALAAVHAHSLYTISTSPPEELQAVYENALARRLALYSDAANLATHELINKDAVSAIKNDVGYRNVGHDLNNLVSIFREAAPRIAGRTATLPSDVDDAELVANQLIQMVAVRDQRQKVDPSVAEDRLRAISLMAKAYEQARRAVWFLRWDRGDADKLAPSIYTAKALPKRRGAEPSVPDQGEVPTLGGVPQVTPTTEPAMPPGVQGGSPFTQP